MTRLKLADLADEKPVRLTIELPTRLHRELTAYAVALNDGDSKGAPPPERLIPPMIAKFINSDRGYTKMRRNTQPG
jgi:hypothetical protein